MALIRLAGSILARRPQILPSIIILGQQVLSTEDRFILPVMSSHS